MFDLGSPTCKRMLFGSRPESCFSARKLKEVFGVPVSCVTVRGYLHLVLWDTSELLVLCVTLVFYVCLSFWLRVAILPWIQHHSKNFQNF